ncbi:hypothetical protein ACX3O0_02385 [Homoserinimonas sp. A447]
MYHSKQGHWTASVLCAILIVGGSAAPVAAAEHPGSPTQSQPSLGSGNCLLMRVGDQYVRCDNFTGAGVRAASWIPEQ